jgi:topoisomerase-4 subunit A
MNKDYSLAPEGSQVLLIDARPKFSFTIKYAPKPRLKKLTEEFKAHKFAVRGLRAGGIRLAAREAEGIAIGAEEEGGRNGKVHKAKKAGG